jgi:hypothetical protein
MNSYECSVRIIGFSQAPDPAIREHFVAILANVSAETVL